MAALTGLSYSELIAKFPKSAGASYYVSKAFKSKKLPLLVGWFVACGCIVSLAAASRAFAGYSQQFINIPDSLLVVLFISVLSFINFRGMSESSFVNMFCTALEATGLLLIIVFGLYFLDSADIPQASLAAEASPGWGLWIGASLAFYAFMGFEDLANVAEEAKNPQKHIPIAIMCSLVVAALFYTLIGWISTEFVSTEDLVKSSAPLVLVMQKINAPLSPTVIAVISLFAVANTALLNGITGSRLLYGMAEENLLPAKIFAVHEKNKTPHVAIGIVFIIAILLGVFSNIEVLAGATSLLLLLTFCMVHISVIRLRKVETKSFQLPIFIPIIGVSTCLFLIALLPREQHMMGGGVALMGLVLVTFYQKKRAP